MAIAKEEEWNIKLLAITGLSRSHHCREEGTTAAIDCWVDSKVTYYAPRGGRPTVKSLKKKNITTHCYNGTESPPRPQPLCCTRMDSG